MKKLTLLYCLIFLSIQCAAFHFVDNKKEDGSLSPAFLSQIVKIFKPSTFIETGTYNGLTALTASQYFQEVHTVELDPRLYQAVCTKNSSRKNIFFYNDQSPQFIEKIAPQCARKGTIVFWLDAHYSGEGTAKSNTNENDATAITPILQELSAIAKTGITDCVILIDDMRGFGSKIDDTEFLGCWAYPCIQEICALGTEINKNFAFALLGDTLMMYDQTKYAPEFSPTVVACTLTRLFNGGNLTEQQLSDLDTVIMQKSTPQEKTFITSLYKKMTDYKDPLFHHDYWYGLICMGDGKWKEAYNALSKVPTRCEYFNKLREKVNRPLFYNPPRIQEYLMRMKKQLNIA